MPAFNYPQFAHDISLHICSYLHFIEQRTSDFLSYFFGKEFKHLKPRNVFQKDLWSTITATSSYSQWKRPSLQCHKKDTPIISWIQQHLKFYFHALKLVVRKTFFIENKNLNIYLLKENLQVSEWLTAHLGSRAIKGVSSREASGIPSRQ